jgi:hypothetical protein
MTATRGAVMTRAFLSVTLASSSLNVFVATPMTIGREGARDVEDRLCCQPPVQTEVLRPDTPTSTTRLDHDLRS